MEKAQSGTGHLAGQARRASILMAACPAERKNAGLRLKKYYHLEFQP